MIKKVHCCVEQYLLLPGLRLPRGDLMGPCVGILIEFILELVKCGESRFRPRFGHRPGSSKIKILLHLDHGGGRHRETGSLLVVEHRLRSHVGGEELGVERRCRVDLL